jgi:hypothetical protein
MPAKTRAELLQDMLAAEAVVRRELSESTVDAYHAALIAFANSSPAAPAPAPAPAALGG